MPRSRWLSLGELLGDVGDRLLHTYDFGDDWEHEITVEELLDGDPEARYPVLVVAKGACPPEDGAHRWGEGAESPCPSAARRSTDSIVAKLPFGG